MCIRDRSTSYLAPSGPGTIRPGARRAPIPPGSSGQSVPGQDPPVVPTPDRRGRQHLRRRGFVEGGDQSGYPPGRPHPGRSTIGPHSRCSSRGVGPRWHDTAGLPHTRPVDGPESVPARLLRPLRATLSTVCHAAYLSRVGSAHHHLVPQLPGSLVPVPEIDGRDRH